jgi:hypothetical protein
LESGSLQDTFVQEVHAGLPWFLTHKEMKTHIGIVMGLFLLMWWGLMQPVQAQDDRELLQSLVEEETASLEAISLYPEEVRNSILEACRFPQAVVRIEALQRNTSQRFQDYISQFPREEQEDLWDMARYPDLISRLSTEGKKSKSALESLSMDYPEEIRPVIQERGRTHMEAIIEMDNMYRASEGAFAGLLRDYPPATRESLRQLVGQPEVLNILSENMSMTVLVGDLYGRNPELVRQELDSLNIEAAKQNAKEVEEWKKTLEENPEAARELEEAAEDFAREEGYDPAVYRSPQTEKTVTVYHHYYYPYPYWFGYPWWYRRPIWYPRPYWYHWGYYYGPGGAIVVFGLPSYYFVHWHYGWNHHFYYYPHLTNCYVSHYQRHRNSMTGFNRATGEWVSENRNDFSGDWLRDDPGRVDRIREYGRLETSLETYNRTNPRGPVSREEYLQMNKNRYPELSKEEEIRSVASPADKPKKPETGIDKTVRPVKPDQTEGRPPAVTNKPKTEPPVYVKPSRPVEIRKPDVNQKMDRARDQHQQQWKAPSNSNPRQPVYQPKPSRKAPAVKPGRTNIPTQKKQMDRPGRK